MELAQIMHNKQASSVCAVDRVDRLPYHLSFLLLPKQGLCNSWEKIRTMLVAVVVGGVNAVGACSGVFSKGKVKDC